MAEHNELGQKGEELARSFLQEHGLRILETNYRYGRDEVDIIAEEGEYLVIVEVKTRSSAFHGEPELFVDRKKQYFLIRAANKYINWKNINKETRFDIVSVLITPNGHKVKHIRDAFYPTLRRY
jgi:putative endonuclease